ncbi:hypothetical protein [Pontibacillus marinus]|uniref:Uncharacterized protein n=1 Tax=Pontibacillus marinus BH030004 = DSM 16465 TaxID=1385511 RepID=A0A0A5FW45_9BACI|nr:hypothetical protein [Pontibacillus marinus]KGX83248.1 hypothetical protein N783_05155 [Pontibacillus marinus BH030004 = DSM 16465]
MFKRKKHTSNDYKNTSLIYFIISAFILFGITVVSFFEGFDKSVISPIVVMVTAFIVGILFRRKGRKEAILSKNDSNS